MRIKFFLSLLLVTTCGCFKGGSGIQAPGAKPQLSYEKFLDDVNSKRIQLKDKPIADAKHYLFQLIHELIPSYWAGTPWDYNGTTRKPGEGKIACGYFITNTLTDLGFDIERIKLAQAPSSVLIKATCSNIHYYSEFADLENYLNESEENSIFIVGLDYHTGYISKQKKDCYFIHSNYLNQQGVTKENLQDSQALKSSKTWMIGSISANNSLIKNWINH